MVLNKTKLLNCDILDFWILINEIIYDEPICHSFNITIQSRIKFNYIVKAVKKKFKLNNDLEIKTGILIQLLDNPLNSNDNELKKFNKVIYRVNTVMKKYKDKNLSTIDVFNKLYKELEDETYQI
jgi:redox-regulated HSP33 family molecular chaperone